MENYSKKSQGYVPNEMITIPPIYSFPPKIINSLNWIFNFFFPWWIIYVGFAYLSWFYFSPSLEAMANLSFDWIFLIWLRNVFFISIFAGGIHWWLYIRKNQSTDYKYYSKWPNQKSKKFLFNNQVKDNIFWSIVSGCTIWTFYETIVLWTYANNFVQTVLWSDHLFYLVFISILMPFLGGVHFYLIHRFLHIPIIYRIAHQTHHNNINTGPWSGISMHPIEHFLYFSIFLVWLVIPVDPFVITLTGIWFGIGPVQSHAGFKKIVLFKNKTIEFADYYHHLHHKHFDSNYGNIYTPIDNIFKTFHNGKVAPKK